MGVEEFIDKLTEVLAKRRTTKAIEDRKKQDNGIRQHFYVGGGSVGVKTQRSLDLLRRKEDTEKWGRQKRKRS